jgi:TRAP-type mannitol/chloroaromatic compound transport system permease small subunit
MAWLRKFRPAEWPAVRDADLPPRRGKQGDIGEDEPMTALLKLSRAIDAVNLVFGRIAEWLVLLAALISAGNATSRYLFSISSNAWLEIQWYMFGGMVLLGAAHTLKLNEHVRVDLVYMSVSRRTQLWIDFLGLIFFLMPAMTVLAWISWPVFVTSFHQGELSTNAGGLIRWPVKLLLPLGFSLIALQGISEIIKRWAALRGELELDLRYEKPLQ